MRSRATITLVFGSTIAVVTAVAACTQLVGLDAFKEVPEKPSDGAPGATTTPTGTTPATDAPTTPGPPTTVTSPPPGPEGLALTRRWARWPMPNPPMADAGADASLPNPAGYVDAGSGTVEDTVTHLVWEATVASASTFEEATAHCTTKGMLVPSRIELATLIWPQNSPAIAPIFAATPKKRFWTSSPASGRPKGTYWYVDFSSGLIGTETAIDAVRCVRLPR